MATPAGRAESKGASPSTAISTPRAPPPNASSKFSMKSSRANLRRPAPSAARTANSCRRVTPRDRARFATLAQATNNTIATAASRMPSAERALPTIFSVSDCTSALQPALVSGYARCRRSAIVRTSAPACPSVTPGFSRASTLKRCLSARHTQTLRRETGTQKSVSALGKRNHEGITPTTLRLSFPKTTVCPTTDDCPPKRRCHSG